MSFRYFARKQFLRKRSAKDDQAVLRNFENELSSLKRLSHEHLVKMIGSYTDHKTFAFLMDLVVDMNLYQLLEHYKQAQYEWAPSLRSYFGCLANAVAYLHSKKIRHRDLKPENILIKDFKIYIADFGSAFDWSDAVRDTTTDANVPFTARYMAPEVANRQSRSSASDMWSLGVVYLEMVTVLRGQSLRTMRKFIEENGTKHPFVYGNPPATTRWFEQLRLSNAGPDSDNEPLTWIKDLTQPNPERRPKPWALASQIRQSVSSTAFIGMCCADDDEVFESESPPSTSDPGEDADSVSLFQQFEALEPTRSPFEPQVAPSKQSIVEQWLDWDRTTSIAANFPQPISVPEQHGYEEPYQIFDDESIAAPLDNLQDQNPAPGCLQQIRVLETCVGYEITDDGSDPGESTGPLGYEVTEDSSDSEPTIRSPSPLHVTGPLQAPINDLCEILDPNDISVRAVIEQLDSMPEIPHLSLPPVSQVSIHSTSNNDTQPPPRATKVGEENPKVYSLLNLCKDQGHLHDESFSRKSEKHTRSTASTSVPQPPTTIISGVVADSENRFVPPPPTKSSKSVHFSQNGIDARPSIAASSAESRKVPRPTTHRAPKSNHNHDALTEQNIAQLVSQASNKGAYYSRGSGPPPSSLRPAIDSKSKMTAELYMREVWEAADTIGTSVLSVGTRKQLSQMGPAIVWQDHHMHFVEHYAKAGKAAAIRELLKAGCNPGTTKKPNYRPLINAVRAGTQRHNKVVRALLDHGADVNARHPVTGKTALHFALENDYFPGYTNLIRNLLEHAADPNALDKNKDVPLLQILYGGYARLEKHKRDALACLLQPHLETDTNIRSLGTLDMPIHLAVRRHDAVAVGMLIHKGSTVNDRNGAGFTPLQIAASSWKESSPESEMDLLRYLLDAGADVIFDEAVGGGTTALHIAVSRGCVQAARILLDEGINGSLTDEKGRTAAEEATAHKSKISKEAYIAIQKELRVVDPH